MAKSNKGNAARRHAAQLRDEIDHGRTGDKVNAPDPSVAPLGTDDESSGHLPAAEQVEPAVTSERRHGATAAGGQADPTAKHAGRRWAGPAGLLLLLFALAALVLLFFVLPS